MKIENSPAAYGWLAGLLVLLAALLAMQSACGPKHVYVEVIRMPATIAKSPPDTSACDFLPVFGEAPPEPTWPTVEEDFYRRQYVHRLDYTKSVEFQRDIAIAIGEMIRCLEQLNAARTE